MKNYSEGGIHLNQIFEIIIQTVLSFFSIFFIARILGRQQVAQLTLTEYINGITFGSIAATVATDLNQRTWQHMAGLFIFGILTYVMAYVNIKSRRLSKIVQGEPVIVIKNGKILEKNLFRFHYTIDDLTHLLRKKDIFDISSVECGILETTGEISILKKAAKENVKVEDLNIQIKQEEIEKEIIVTGNIIYENLKSKNLSAAWLLKQLKSMGIKDIKNVFYGTIDENNKIYIDRYEDRFSEKEDITELQ